MHAAHVVSHVAIPRLVHADGAVLHVETARNVPTLTHETRAAFAETVIRLGGGGGGVLVGSERSVSDDTHAVGTVFDFGKAGGAAGAGGTPPVTGGGVPAHDEGETCHLPPARPFTPTADWGDRGRARGARAPAGPHPVVARIRAAIAPAGSKEQLAAAADAGAEATVGLLLGLRCHDVRGGDNPHPQALVFALPPGGPPAAAAVADAFTRCVARVPLLAPAVAAGASVAARKQVAEPEARRGAISERSSQSRPDPDPATGRLSAQLAVPGQ